MFAEERQDKIYDIICQRRSAKVSELSNLLEISEVTVRRDLDELQRQKLISRTHGGAVLQYSVGKAITAEELISKDQKSKQKIAKTAYEMIVDDDTLLLDSSSTVYELVKLIAVGKKKDLRVITTSLLVLQTLLECENCTVMIVGGEVNRSHHTVEGVVANRFIKDIRVDKCFCGVNGIDEEFGLSTPRYEDAEIKNLIEKSAVKSYILADYTKFGKVYLAKVAAPGYLITDRMLEHFPYETMGNQTEIIFAEQIGTLKLVKGPGEE